VAPLSVLAERPARGVGLFGIDGNELDACAVDEHVQIPEALGSEASLDDDRDFDEGRRRQQARFCALDGFVEEPAFGFVEKDCQEGGVSVLAEDFVGCPRVQHGQPGAMPGDLIELVGETPPGPLAAHAGKTVPQGLGHSLGFRLPGELRQGLSQLFSLFVADVQGHGSPRPPELPTSPTWRFTSRIDLLF
jgi:hypothetical protein